MTGAAVKEFVFDWNMLMFRPADLTIRMYKRNQKGERVRVPIEGKPEFEILKTEHRGLVSFSNLRIVDDAVLADAALTQTLLGLDRRAFYKQVDDLNMDPIKVKVSAAPKTGSPVKPGKPPQKLSETLLMRVGRSRYIDWATEDGQFKGGDTIEIAGDGQSRFGLKVWVVEWDPRTHMWLPEDIEYDFSHMSDIDKTKFANLPLSPRESFAIRDNRRSTNWGSKARLKEAEPISGNIRVRAWPPKTVTWRENEEIGVAPGVVMVAETQVPIGITPDKIMIERLDDVGTPIAALSSTTHDLRFRLFYESNRAPLRNTALSWKLDSGEITPPGKLDRTEGMTDDDGAFDVQYTPPDLTYKPGGRFFENFVVFRGAGAGKARVAEWPLLLAPEIRVRMNCFKPCLDFAEHVPDQPRWGYEYIVPPKTGRGIVALTGTIVLEDHAGEAGTDVPEFFPVHYATAAFRPWDGRAGQYVENQLEAETNRHGEFRLALPELARIYQGEADETVEYSLNDNFDVPSLRLAQNAVEMIEKYLTSINGKNRDFQRYLDEDRIQKILGYRQTYCGQLASEPKENCMKVLAGADLLRFGLENAGNYTRSYYAMNKQAWETFLNLFQDVVGWILDWDSTGKLIKGAFARLASGAEKFVLGLPAAISSGVRSVMNTLEALLGEWVTDPIYVELKALKAYFDKLDRFPRPYRLVEAEEAIGEVLKNLFMFILKLIGWMLSRCLRLAMQAAAGAADIIVKGLEWLRGQDVIGIGDEAQDAIKELFTYVLGTAEIEGEAAVLKIGKALAKGFEYITGGLLGGVSSVAGWIADYFDLFKRPRLNNAIEKIHETARTLAFPDAYADVDTRDAHLHDIVMMNSQLKWDIYQNELSRIELEFWSNVAGQTVSLVAIAVGIIGALAAAPAGAAVIVAEGAITYAEYAAFVSRLQDWRDKFQIFAVRGFDSVSIIKWKVSIAGHFWYTSSRLMAI